MPLVWRPDLNLAIFISVFLVLILAFNLLPVRLYGELEFFFGILKSLLIVGLIIAGLLVDWGASPSGEYIGGKNWHPDPIREYLVTGSTGMIAPPRDIISLLNNIVLGRFLAFWNVLSKYMYN